MVKLQSAIRLPAITMIACLSGCSEFGSVNQGRVIHFDAAKGLITLISDSNPSEPASPKFDVLPPAIVKLPTDIDETGPIPEAGKLMRLDTAERKLVVYDDASHTFRALSYEPVRQQENVARDDPRVAGKRFPVVNREEGTITLYSQMRRLLLTFRAPTEYLDLPEDTWRTGDVVRYYYKDPGKALRFMNVSKIDLRKSGE